MSPGDVVIWPDQLNLPPYVGVVLDSWPGECNGLAEEPPLRVRVLWDDGDVEIVDSSNILIASFNVNCGDHK